MLTAGCTAKPSSPASDVTLSKIEGPGLAKIVAGHEGQVVLLDFWATWCGPCLELFPHTVELQRRFGGRGLTVITISLDDPDNEPAVRKFLAQSKATDRELSLALRGRSRRVYGLRYCRRRAAARANLRSPGEAPADLPSGGKTIDAKGDRADGRKTAVAQPPSAGWHWRLASVGPEHGKMSAPPQPL